MLVANRSDLASPSQLDAFHTFAEALWPPPLHVSVTRRGELPSALFDWPEGEGPRAPEQAGGEAAHAHDSTAGFRARSWKWSPDVVFSRDRLTTALRGLAGEPALARFKGIFRTLEGVWRLEISGAALHEEGTSFRRDSRADAIAKGSGEILDRVAKQLADAVLDERERNLDASRIDVVLPGGSVHGIDREQLLALPDGVEDVSALFPKRAGTAARVSSLLDRLGCGASGEAVVVAGDGFASEPVDLAVLREGVLLHSLEGEPLPEGQGGPFRLLIPEHASPEPVSCANVKGVAKIVVRGR